MSKQNSDSRKKIISVPQELGSIQIASQVDVLFPCNMFEVALPVMPKSKLNIFEETVLKLLNLGTAAPEKLAEKTAMESELIAFILNRLQQTDYIDKHNKLTDRGNNFFENTAEPTDIKRVKVFIELIDGNVLPAIYPKDVPFTFSTAKNDSGMVLFSSGKAGKTQNVWAYILYEKPEHITRSIEVHDVLQTVKSYQKTAAQNKILRGEESAFVPNADLISINNNPELVYVHCKAVIQETNNELFVSAGVGTGYSAIFKECLQQERQEIITEQKQLAAQHIVQRNEQKNETLEIVGFGNAVNRYTDIKVRLLQAEYRWNKIDTTVVKSENDSKQLTEHINQFIKLVYELLEWTLRYVVNDTHTETISPYLFQQNGGEFLRRCAEKIGLTIPSFYGALLNVNAGKIDACQNGQSTDMESLLAVSIYDASQNLRHPLHNIIKHELSAEFDSGSDKSFLEFIAELKRQRDKVSHGERAEVRSEDIKIIRDTTYRFVKELIPVLSGEKVTVQTSLAPIDDVNQIYLKSQIALESSFGYNEFRVLDKTTKDLLERIEKNTQVGTDAVFGNIVVDLASLMQRIFFLKYKSGIIRVDTGNENYKSVAIQKAVAAGFELQNKQFGKSISTVQEKFISAAVKGDNRSIGANLLSFLINADENTLQDVAEKIPNLITLTEELAVKRGHGNNIGQTYSREEILRLKQAVYEAVKTLQEI